MTDKSHIPRFGLFWCLCLLVPIPLLLIPSGSFELDLYWFGFMESVVTFDGILIAWSEGFFK